MDSALIFRRSLLAAGVALALLGGSAQAQSTPSVADSVQLGGSLYEIVFDADDDRVLVASAGGRGEGARGHIFSLDGQTLEVEDTYVLEPQAFGLAFNAQNDRLYIVDTRGLSLAVMDANSGEMLGTLSLEREVEGDGRSPQPRLAAVDAERNRVYVTGVGDPGVIWVVDGERMALLDTFENLGPRPTGLALSDDGQRLYTTLLGNNRVAVVDADSGEVLHSWESGVEGAINVRLDHQRNRLLVTGQGSGELAVLDADSGEVVNTLQAGEGALDVAIDPQADRLYVTNRDAGTVSVFDADSYETLATLETGLHPNSVAVDPASHSAWVTNKASRDNPDADNGNTVTLIR